MGLVTDQVAVSALIKPTWAAPRAFIVAWAPVNTGRLVPIAEFVAADWIRIVGTL